MLTLSMIPVETPYKVYDIRTRSVIFSAACGPVPANLNTLPVIRVYACNDTIYIDTEV